VNVGDAPVPVLVVVVPFAASSVVRFVAVIADRREVWAWCSPFQS
jgi:hypothetical protein